MIYMQQQQQQQKKGRNMNRKTHSIVEMVDAFIQSHGIESIYSC